MPGFLSASSNPWQMFFVRNTVYTYTSIYPSKHLDRQTHTLTYVFLRRIIHIQRMQHHCEHPRFLGFTDAGCNVLDCHRSTPRDGLAAAWATSKSPRRHRGRNGTNIGGSETENARKMAEVKQTWAKVGYISIKSTMKDGEFMGNSWLT